MCGAGHFEIAIVRSLLSCLAISQFYKKTYCGLNFTYIIILKMGIEQHSIAQSRLPVTNFESPMKYLIL